MKITLLSITTCSFLLLGCTNNTKNIIQTSSNIYLSEKNKEPGGNPEVMNFHLCFNKKNKMQQKNCLNNYLDKEDKKIVIYIAKNRLLKPISSRDSTQDLRTFNLQGKEEFIIYTNLDETIGKISTNIPHAKLYQENNKVTIKIDVKDIEDKVILYNNNSEVLVEYRIIK